MSEPVIVDYLSPLEAPPVQTRTAVIRPPVVAPQKAGMTI